MVFTDYAEHNESMARKRGRPPKADPAEKIKREFLESTEARAALQSAIEICFLELARFGEMKNSAADLRRRSIINVLPLEYQAEFIRQLKFMEIDQGLVCYAAQRAAFALVVENMKVDLRALNFADAKRITAQQRSY
jgi:hypothetical protein